jgi:hypothetical protein
MPLSPDLTRQGKLLLYLSAKVDLAEAVIWIVLGTILGMEELSCLPNRLRNLAKKRICIQSFGHCLEDISLL